MEAEGNVVKAQRGSNDSFRTSRRIAGNDVREAWRDGRFVATLLLALLLLGLSLEATVYAYRNVQEQRSAAMAETHAQFVSQRQRIHMLPRTTACSSFSPTSLLP